MAYLLEHDKRTILQEFIIISNSWNVSYDGQTVYDVKMQSINFMVIILIDSRKFEPRLLKRSVNQ